jgi:glycosyltransferase involved in cell wall biosynthesis
MYETYGMSAIEAAGYGIPSIHVDTPHVREGIGDAAILVPPLDTEATARAIDTIEKNYERYSKKVKEKAQWLQDRQQLETKQLIDFIANIKKPGDNSKRKYAVVRATRAYRK